MEQKVRKMISEAGAEVFGTMYFMPIQLEEKIPEASLWNLESTYVASSIAFSGPQNGAIKFFFPGSLSRKIVGGFLGLEDSEVTDSQALDTMQEAANMMIGSFLGKIDPDGACKLGIPTSELVEGFSPADLQGDAELLVFESEFGFLWMTYA